MNTAPRLRGLARAFFGLTAITYVLVVFGALVRVKGAGLSCPDWPLCFGKLLPSLDLGVILEWGHRTLAGSISLLLVAALGVAWRTPSAWKALGRMPWIVLGVLGIQIILGGLTVLKLLASWTVTLHLLFGNLFCLALLVMALRLRDASRPATALAPLPRGWWPLLTAGALLLFAQMVLGGLVSSNHAGFACLQWPACQGDVWFPAFTGLIGLQVFHRLVAYALAGTIGVIAVVGRGHPQIGRPALAALALVIVQVVLGVLNVLWLLPVEITAGHSAGAAGLVLLFTVLVRNSCQGRCTALVNSDEAAA
jgi:cytochrome c oxidase assembly protein subunit 15